jgi:outer membrane protein TolC
MITRLVLLLILLTAPCVFGGCKMTLALPSGALPTVRSEFHAASILPAPPATTPIPSHETALTPQKFTLGIESEASAQQASRLEEIQPQSSRPIESTAPSTLHLQDVLSSVLSSYPLLQTAMLEAQVASGKTLSTLGAFDLELKAFGISTPQGYYQNYRQGIGVNQPLLGGGYVYSGYKNGDGDFQPWYKERETNEGGEFAAGFGVPLLKGRDIDKRREALYTAALQREAVEPFIQGQLLEFNRLASREYWDWMVAGLNVQTQTKLLELAQNRVEIVETRVAAGDLAPIARINNEQLIASRETKVIEAQRKFQKAAIKLSLYFRNAEGEPLVPKMDQVPSKFPDTGEATLPTLDESIVLAFESRPEFLELDLLSQQVRVELSQASNMLLPKLDAQLLASKDVGAAASSKGDKTPFELEVGLYGELPFQRREARGKAVSARGKLSQIQTKRDFVANKVIAELQDAHSALEAASQRITRARRNVDLASQTQTLGQAQFDAGDIDLIDLNIYEQSATDAELQWLLAQGDFFKALADYRAAIAAQAPALEK